MDIAEVNDQTQGSDYNYCLRDDLSITYDGVKLFRVQATRDIPRFGVEAGDLGGYIESHRHLYGDAWVSEQAKVFGPAAAVYDKAFVSGFAVIRDSAVIRDTAHVNGSAVVGSSAVVCGDAAVGGESSIMGSARVSGHADVGGRASVAGDAKISGSAIIVDHVQVYGSARVGGSCVLTGDMVVPGDTINRKRDWCVITNDGPRIIILPNSIKIGDQYHSRSAWLGFPEEAIRTFWGNRGVTWWRMWKPILMNINLKTRA